MTAKLDYIRDIGAGGLILSSIYQSHTGTSPRPDVGYEVTDHKDVHPEYGSLEDLDTLIQQAHAKGSPLINNYLFTNNH